MPRRGRLVHEVMSNRLVRARPGMSLAEAYDLMTENEVRRLPVLDGDLVGIITLSDILRAAPGLVTGEDEHEGESNTRVLLATRKVREVMTYDPVTITPDDTVQEAAEEMLEYEVSGLPVVQGQQVIGMITESDIFRFVVESWSEIEPD